MAEEKTAITPLEQHVIDFYGDEVYAALVEVAGEQRVYIPVKPLSDAMGLSWSGQSDRIRRDPELSEVMQLIRIPRMNPGAGRPEYLSIPLEFLAGWLFGIRTNMVKTALREKVRRYKLECYRALHQHFQGETLARRETGTSLAQIRGMALAVAEMAAQQMVMESRLDTHDARLNRAAEIVGTLQRRVTAIENRVTPASFITDEQATQISITVKALAQLIGGHYNTVFSELYRRFGVSSYKVVRQEQYEAVLAFLEDWRIQAREETTT